MEQLALAFPMNISMASADFMVSDANREAHAWIQRWPAWEAHGLILTGPAAAGKTHLARLWAVQADAQITEGIKLERSALPEGRRLVVEQAERAEAEALFHLLNSIRERQGGILLTSRLPLSEWGVALPDLTSRLRALPQAQLQPPDDGLLRAVLSKHFRDRQMRLPEEVADYLTLRMERSLAAAQRIAEMLDCAAMAQKRSITLPFAREILLGS